MGGSPKKFDSLAARSFRLHMGGGGRCSQTNPNCGYHFWGSYNEDCSIFFWGGGVSEGTPKEFWSLWEDVWLDQVLIPKPSMTVFDTWAGPCEV